MGDCADVKSKAASGGELLDKADELFKRADVDKNGAVDKGEFVNILKTLEESYPQIATLTKGAADGMLHDILSKFDDDGDGSLDRREFRRAMAEADSRLASHPATAQVANQQGEYLARELNAQGRARRNGVEDPAPTKRFEYVHLGSFATLGGEQAALDTSGSPLPLDFVSQGIGTMVLWYGVYFSNCVSWRNKAMVVLGLDEKASGDGTPAECDDSFESQPLYIRVHTNALMSNPSLADRHTRTPRTNQSWA